VTIYHKEYEAASKAFRDCNPDQVDGKCDINKQSQLSITMSEAGNRMIENDDLNQKNKNKVEALNRELIEVQA